MKEKALQLKNQFGETWGKLTKGKKIFIISSLVLVSILLVFFVYFSSKTNYVQIYSNLSQAETGEIKEAIEAKGIPVEISTDGKGVSVPQENASALKVELAAAGIPKSGNVNYSVFSENMSFGVTDKQFDVVERDAMQNELRDLIRSVDGIQDATVMITLPKENLWLSDEESYATASVTISTTPGVQLDQTQVNGLYHLISKSVPNLTEENITIVGNGGVSYDYVDGAALASGITLHKEQREIKRDIQNDIQKEIQMMLSRILGNDKVVVSVLANVDFSKEKREEQLVEPVDKETQEGIAISVERIQEKYKGEGATMESVAGTGETDVANYPSTEGGNENNEYEKTEERINTEVNRIHKQIEESPYDVVDLAIQVGVEPPDPENPDTLTEETLADIESVLSSIIRTSINNEEITDEQINDKITVFVNKFEGENPANAVQQEVPQNKTTQYILYGVSGLAVLLLIIIVVMAVRSGKRKKEESEVEEVSTTENNAPLIDEIEDFEFGKVQDNEDTLKRKRIENLVKRNPDEFIKLLKTWMNQD